MLRSLDWRLILAGALYWCQTNLVYHVQTFDGLNHSGRGISVWAITLIGNLVALALMFAVFSRKRWAGSTVIAGASCAAILAGVAILGGVYAGLIDRQLLWIGILAGGMGEGALLALFAELFTGLFPREVLGVVGLQQIFGAVLFLAFSLLSPEMTFLGIAVVVIVQTYLLVRSGTRRDGGPYDESALYLFDEPFVPWLISKDVQLVLAVASLAVGLCYGAVMALVVVSSSSIGASGFDQIAVAPLASTSSSMAGSTLAGGVLLVVSAVLPRRNPEGFLFQIAVPLLALGLACIPLLVRNVPLALPLLLMGSTYFFGILWYFISLVDGPDAPKAGKVAAGSFFAFLLGHLMGRSCVELGPAPLHDASLVSIALLLMTVLLLVVYISRYKRYEQRLVNRAEQHEFEVVCETVTARYGLTEREASVFRLLALGFSAKKIAEKLIVSENTAKTHVRHVYSKLGIHSREELNDIVRSLAV